MRGFLRFSLLCTSMLGLHVAADAQTVMTGQETVTGQQVVYSGQDIIVVGADVSLRPHPRYDPLPIHAASFNIVPQVSTSLNYNDNVLAQNSNRQSDAFVVVRPEVTIGSDWSRNSLNLDLYAQKLDYAKLTSENVTTYGGTGQANLDVAHNIQIVSQFSGQHLSENLASLGSFRGATRASTFNQLSAQVSANLTMGDVLFQTTGSIERLVYQPVQAQGGIASQNYRDMTLTSGQQAVTYNFSPSIGLVANAQYSHSGYDFKPGSAGFDPLFNLDRDSHEVQFNGGVNLALNNVIFGTVQLGYYHLNYNDLRLRDGSGLNVAVNMLWNPTPLTSVSLFADRRNSPSASTTVAGNSRHDFTVKVNHELYRNVLLMTSATYSTYKPNGPGNSGTEVAGSMSARYLFNTRLSATASMNYSARDTSDTSIRYHQLSGSLMVHYAI